jgi:nitroreductase
MSAKLMKDAASLDAMLARRHSCRGFLPRAVPRPVVEHVLASAGRSASWCNAQPWHAYVLSGAPLDKLRADLMERATSGVPATPELDWPGYTGVYRERRRECGWSLYKAVGVGKGDRERSARQALENFRMFGAPHLALLTSHALLGTHGVMDCGAWVSTRSHSCGSAPR